MTRLFARPPSLPGALALCALFACVGCDSRTRVLVGSDTMADARPTPTADAMPDVRTDLPPNIFPGAWTGTPLSVPGDVYAIWASEDGSRVWAAGRRGQTQPILWRLDGEQFIEATPPEIGNSAGSTGLRMLWGSASGKLWTIDGTTSLPPWHFDGHYWRATSGLPVNTTIARLRGRGETAWLAGRRSGDVGLVARWNGDAWVAQQLSGTEFFDIIPLEGGAGLALGWQQNPNSTAPGALWHVRDMTIELLTNTPPFAEGCALTTSEALLLGYFRDEARDWARWSASDGLLPLSGNVVPLVRQAAGCWDGHAFVVADGQVLQIDSAQAQVIGSAPSPAVLGPNAQMAVSRTDIWLAGTSINQIWRLRRPGP